MHDITLHVCQKLYDGSENLSFTLKEKHRYKVLYLQVSLLELIAKFRQMVTAINAEVFDNFQHSMRLIVESRNDTDLGRRRVELWRESVDPRAIK